MSENIEVFPMVEPFALKEFRGGRYLLAKEIDGRLEESSCINIWRQDTKPHRVILSERKHESNSADASEKQTD